MRTAEILRATSRALINDFFNGKPLWNAQEQKDNRILFTFNDKSGAVLLHTARAQFENAFMKQGNLFKVTIPDAPPDKQAEWSNIITTAINKPIMRSNGFMHTEESVWGGVVLHGISSQIWWDDHKWQPDFKGIQDILIPTDTELTMDNLPYMAVRRKMRPGQLFKQTFAKEKRNINRGWDLKAVRTILNSYRDLNANTNNYNWADNPEQMAELYKQNQNYYDGDSAPMITAWDFIYREEETENPGWYKKILLDKDSVVEGLTTDDIATRAIYSSPKPIAANLNEIIHFQFGDGNNVPPFMYHSVRSLAFLTYELLWTMNRLRCQWTQHVFEQMLILFRIQDPSDRSRLQKIVMEAPWGILPEGLNMVRAEERYSCDANLVGGLKAEYKQLVGEASSSYTQEFDNGTSKERTKFEVQALLTKVSSLMSSMLNRAARQKYFQCLEIARRFSIKKSRDFDVKKFRNTCREAGIPDKWIDSERWDISVEQTLGGGNRMMELAEASELMQNKDAFEPSAQQEIKHSYALALTGNYRMANRLAPLDATPKVTDAIHDAELAFGTLMQGIPVTPKEGVNHPETVETMLRLMTLIIDQINQSGGVGTPQQAMGLNMVAVYVQKQLQFIELDPNNKPMVKQYSDQLGKLMNQVNAMLQRQQQAAQSNNGNGHGMPPEAQAKIASSMVVAETSSKIKEAQAEAKLRQGEEKFVAGERRKDEQTQADIARGNAKAVAEAFQNRTVENSKPEAKSE